MLVPVATALPVDVVDVRAVAISTVEIGAVEKDELTATDVDVLELATGVPFVRLVEVELKKTDVPRPAAAVALDDTLVPGPAVTETSASKLSVLSDS